MNEMKLHFDLQQEDELGKNLLSGLRVSPNRLIFMKDEMECRKYQFLKEGEVRSEKELGSWIRSFQKLIWKVKLRDALKQKDWKMPRQLVLKSPCHSGRVILLLKLYGTHVQSFSSFVQFIGISMNNE